MSSHLAVIVLCLFLGVVTGAETTGGVRRLSDNIVPSRYRLDITTFLEDNFTFHGEVWIEIDVTEPSEEIVLHSKNLQILSANVERISKNNEDVKIYFVDKRIVSNTITLSPPNSSKIIFPGRNRVEADDTVVANGEEHEESNTEASESSTSEKNTNMTTDEDSAFLSQLYDIFQPPTVSTTTLTLVKRKTRYLARVSATFSVASLPVDNAYLKTHILRQNNTMQREERNDTSLHHVKTNTSTTTTNTSTTTTNISTTTNTSTNHEVVKVSIINITIDAENEMVHLKLSGQLEKNTKYRLYLKFSALLSDNLTGFYKIPYKDKGINETRWLATTVFESTLARKAFPCFDEPNFKAVFQVNLARRIGMQTLSNMELSNTQTIAGRPGWVMDSYKESPPMSTYLVAFFVGQLKSRETTTSRGKPLRIWTRRGVLDEQTNYTLELGPKYEQFFESYLDVKNPLNKTDLLALPIFVSDALENWGLISFEEKYILYQPGVSTLSSKQTVATVLAHELAHTWFGNLVTLDWWSNIWLNEGFAVYFASLAVDFVHPEWEFQSVHAVKAFLRVFAIDALRSSHPLIPVIKSQDDFTNLFDAITYYKGFYLLRMVHHTLGEETFRKGIRSYLKDSVFGNVGQDDVWRYLTQQAHEDGTLELEQNLVEMMSNWTNVPGYPVVSVLRDYESGTIDLVQNRFLRAADDVESRTEPMSEDTSWWIPVSYTSETELRFNVTTPRFWLDPAELVSTIDEHVPSSDHWVLFNIQATGYYRVNYDLDNWALLSRYLASDNYHHIDVLNRAQLIDDVLDFARAGDVSYPVALGLTSYIRREEHYLPWLSTFSNMDYIQRMLRTTNTSLAFKGFVRSLVTPMFNQLGFVSPANEKVLDTLNRQQIVFWACQTGVPSCVQQAVALFKEWMDIAKTNNITNPIASNLRLAVYCTAIEQGGELEWSFLLLKYLTATIASERSSVLASLGCTRHVHILKKYLELTIQGNSGLRKQDGLSVFKAVANNELGLNLAAAFFKDNFNKIHNVIKLPSYLDVLATMMNSEEQLQKMEELQEEHLDVLRSNSQPIQMANEKLRFNIEWLKRNLDPISLWLQERSQLSHL